MPTGYTACIEKGATFKEYLLGCARAFGALVTMREEPMDAKIPKAFKPNSYHLDEINKSEKELKKIDALSHKEIEKICRKEFDNELKEIDTRIKELEKVNEKYSEIRRQAEDWVPPTSGHRELKKFMLDQIDISIEVDMIKHYEERRASLKIKSVKQWKKDKVKSALEDISYHKKQYAKELETCNRRTEWVKKLIESV